MQEFGLAHNEIWLLQFSEARQAAGIENGTLPSLEIDVLENKDSQLWVDKYAPSVFTELLSDEVTSLYSP